MTALTLAIEKRLRALIPMLASDQPGEVTAAAVALKKELQRVGADLHDFAEAAVWGLAQRGDVLVVAALQWRGPLRQTSWQSAAAFCLRHVDRLNEWETRFARSMAEKVGSSAVPSPKQRDTLFAIFNKLREAGHA